MKGSCGPAASTGSWFLEGFALYILKGVQTNIFLFLFLFSKTTEINKIILFICKVFLSVSPI